MAKAATQTTAKSTNFTAWLWGAGLLAMWILASAPSLIIFGLGMLPTLVAYICDRTEQKYALFCVGGLNFCGTFPFLLKLSDDHSISAAMNIMSDVFSLAIIFASAGFGWMIFLSIPPVISSFLTVLAESRVKTLKTIQKHIVDEWGTSVSESNGSANDATLEMEREAPVPQT